MRNITLLFIAVCLLIMTCVLIDIKTVIKEKKCIVQIETFEYNVAEAQNVVLPPAVKMINNAK